MSEVVENVSEQQISAPSNEAAQSTEAVSKEITNNVEEAVPVANETAPTANTETGEESLQKPATEESSSTSPKVDNKKTPVKRPRLSFIERAQKESEELVRTLGGSLEMEGGRRTRSSTRGTPTRSAVVSTPPPAKKSRASPASGASTPTRARARGRKLDTATDGSADEETSPTTSKKKTPAKGKKSAAKESLEEHHDDEKQDVKQTEKEEKADDSTPAPAEKDNVDSVVTADVVSEETKAEEVLAEAKTEINKETVDELREEVSKTEDKTDAVLEPVVEETQSQVVAETIAAEENITKEPENDSHNEKILKEETKNIDSPMETEEEAIPPPKESEEKEIPNVEVESHNAIEAAVKEPTPEPMEVDSSSKSNETFEKLEHEVAELIEQPQTLAPEVEAEILSTNTVNTVQENVEQNSLLVDGVAVLNSDIVENNTTGAILVNEPPAEAVAIATNVAIGNFNEKSTEETTPAANNDLNKTENDLCEPKIATSPPISAANDNGSVTTPQTCN